MPPGPDLSIQRIRAEHVGIVGIDCKLVYQLTIVNQGDADAGGFDIVVNGTVERYDGLEAGRKILFNSSAEVGDWPVEAIIDGSYEIAEADEDNNIYAVASLEDPTDECGP